MGRITLTLFLILMTSSVFSQNLISPLWKYQVINEPTELNSIDENKWQDINLLLSWERQGFGGLGEKCVIKNDFFVEENTKMKLEFSFAAEVASIYINGKQISGKVENTFWSNRGKMNTLAIPDSMLLKSSKNSIVVFFNELSWTGGKSHNYCSIYETNKDYENSVSISIPTENHVYLLENDKTFTIQSNNIANNTIKLIINNDFRKTFVTKTIDIEKGKQEYKFDFSEYNLKPGLYEIIAISEGKTFCGNIAWIAVRPEDIKCSVEKFDGFDKFWENALGELDAIKPDFKTKKVDSLCSTTKDGYVIEMQSYGNLTIRGYYFVPKSEGKYPALLHLPGYNYGFEYLDGFINNEKDVIELALCIRGHGLSKDVFNPWDTMTLWANNICNEENYVYKAIYLDCVRAVDFLLSRPEVNTSKIGVEGGSQAGGLALATAALCNENIAACAIFNPFLCNFEYQSKMRTIIKRELELFSTLPGNNCNSEKMFDVLKYIDTRYFTSDIKCPVYFSSALIDDDCYPHCGFSVYNNLKSNKEYKIYPKDSHIAESDQYNKLHKILENMLLK